MKTIFVSSFHQFISRNILRTPIVEGLLRLPEVRIVIVVPADKKEYFTKEFGGPGIAIEGIRTSRAANGFWSFFFKRLAQAISDGRYRSIARGGRKSQSGLRYRLVTVFFYRPAQLLGTFAATKAVMRFLNYLLVKNAEISALFEAYAPSVVFSTDAQNENDVLLTTEAKRRGVKVIAMFRSWDNIETKGLLRVVPDTLLVWGSYLRDEVVRLDGMRADDVKVVGVPHYDRYLQGPLVSRKEFFASIGADPAKKLILFTPIGDMYLRENDADGFVLSELSKRDENILVRMPPADTVSLGTFTPGENVFFYQPGNGAGGIGRRELTREDDDHLLNALHFSDVVVSGPSTIMLDAALVDTPVVLFGFEKNKKAHGDSIMSHYDLKYLRIAIDNDAATLAENVSDFHAAIDAYLRDPGKDAAGRKRAVGILCHATDGRSSERVLDILKAAIFSDTARNRNKENVLPYYTADEIRNSKKREIQEAYARYYGGDIVLEGQAVNVVNAYLPCGRRGELKVCDFGAASGAFLKELYHEGFRELYAVDLDDYMDGQVKSSGIIKEFKLVDLSFDTLTWPDEYFDVISAWCLLPHLENPFHAMREISRLLKPGGIFMASMPHIASLFAKKLYFRSGEISRYTAENDHIAILTPAVFTKAMGGQFVKKGIEYFTDIPKIRAGRLGWIKTKGITKNWRGRKKCEEWFGHQIIYVFQKKPEK